MEVSHHVLVHVWISCHWQGQQGCHQSVRREPLPGTSAQRTVINAIIATNLYTTHESGPPNREHRTHKGCKELIPVFDAIAPVMKGNNAEPA